MDKSMDTAVEALLPASLSDRQGFNRRWFASDPNLAVYRPQTAHDVVLAWNEAIHNGIGPNQLQITCGRHCYENFVYNPGIRAVIDMTGLKGYGTTVLSTGQAAAYIDVGLGNWDMYRLMNNVYQKTLPAGSCYSVGLGGHITGGGYGLLSRLYGLTIDHLIGVDIVVERGTGTPEMLHCNNQNDANLLWGVRGGGGAQFGIITRYYFDLAAIPQSPSEMATSVLTFDWADLDKSSFKSVIRFFIDRYCGQDQTTWNRFAILHGNHKDAGALNIFIATYNPADSGMSSADFRAEVSASAKELAQQAAAIAPLSTRDCTLNGHPYVPSTHALGVGALDPASLPPGASTTQYFTYLEGTQNVNGSGPNRHGKYKSAYHTAMFSDVMLDAMYDGLTTPVYNPDTGQRVDMSASLIQMDSYGGAINTVGSSATAIPQRSSIAKLQYQTYWQTDTQPNVQDTGLAKAHVNWINTMYGNIYSQTGGVPVSRTRSPNFGTDGCYFNYCDVDIGNVNDGKLQQALELYFGQNATPLTNVARQYNPKGWFRNSQSVTNTFTAETQ